ncbi:FtsX-like permease family protein [Anaerobacillus alkaliphilus]|nr:ABC transporter permease [Anaerobacillus alkaliphilus]
MTYNQFILKTILFNYRKYLAYFFCITFSMTVFFLFTAIWFAPDFAEETSRGTRQIVQIAGVIASAFSIFIITYSYQQFLKSRTREFGILLSYGLLYRDMRRMIFLENSLIFLTAIFTSFISGSVFSRLTFMITTTILGINDLHFELTLPSYWLTFVVFVPIYVIIIFLTMLKLKKYSVTNLIKVNRMREMKHTGKKLIVFLGIVIIISAISLMYIYTSDFSNVGSMRQVILITILSCVVGMFLVISHFSSLLHELWKKHDQLFYKYLLPITEFSSKYSQHRAIIFIVCLLSMGIVFFSTLTYTLYQQSYAIADKEQLYDVIMKDYQAIALTEQLEVDELVVDYSHLGIIHQNLEVVYLEAPEMRHTPWRTNKRIMVASVEEFNRIYSSHYEVQQGSTLVIDFNQSGTESIDYFGEAVLIKSEEQLFSLRNMGMVQMKLFDRYVFSQPVLLVLNKIDFEQIRSHTENHDVGLISMFTFRDWRESGDFVQRLREQMEIALQEISELEAFETIKAKNTLPFVVHSKHNRYLHTKQVAGFALFIMSFISILFFVTVCVVLHFKIFADQDDDRQKLKLLRTIGITSKEVGLYLNQKLLMVIALPVVLGGFLGVVISVAINLYNVTEMEITNTIIFYNGLLVVTVYFLFISVYYVWLSSNYRRAVE